MKLSRRAWLAAALLAAAAPALAEPALVAHRGLSGDFPENSLAAFRAAIALGVDAIELDLRTTADGELVVLHDAALDRTTGARGRIAAMTLAQVRALPARPDGTPAIPTLAEVLALARGTKVRLLLDIKAVDEAGRRRIVDLVESYVPQGAVTIGVRSVAELRAFRRLAPELRLLAFLPDRSSAAQFAREGVAILRLWSRWVDPVRGGDPKLVERVRRLGREVWIIAEEEPGEPVAAVAARLRRLRALDPDAIMTDHPELLLQDRGRIRNAPASESRPPGPPRQ